MSVTVDEVVAAYIKLRLKKEQMEAEVKAETKKIVEKMDKFEAWLKEQADAQGVTSFKTKHGTAFLKTTDYANVENWDAALKFILDTQAFDLLNKAVSKVAVRGYIDANKAVPPGVNYGTKIEVEVRKPATRVED
jgi:hypothetical protein